MRVGIATDHGGFEVKEELAAYLRGMGHEVIDVGARNLNPGDDYPGIVIPLAQAVASGKVERGVAVCGSGMRSSRRSSRAKNATSAGCAKWLR